MKITDKIKENFTAVKFCQQVLSKLEMTKEEKDTFKEKVEGCITKMNKV